VLPEHRRRGVARALKAAQVEWALRHGIGSLRTENDLRNAPIRALNEEMGYRARPARVLLRGPVDPQLTAPRARPAPPAPGGGRRR
jgi:GNAT superfamily N-acetyltransferase